MSHQASTGRVEGLLARELGGVPLVLIICAVAAFVLGFGVAMTSSLT